MAFPGSLAVETNDLQRSQKKWENQPSVHEGANPTTRMWRTRYTVSIGGEVRCTKMDKCTGVTARITPASNYMRFL
jgi:hypothetical protein